MRRRNATTALAALIGLSTLGTGCGGGDAGESNRSPRSTNDPAVAEAARLQSEAAEEEARRAEAAALGRLVEELPE